MSADKKMTVAAVTLVIVIIGLFMTALFSIASLHEVLIPVVGSTHALTLTGAIVTLVFGIILWIMTKVWRRDILDIAEKMRTKND